MGGSTLLLLAVLLLPATRATEPLFERLAGSWKGCADDSTVTVFGPRKAAILIAASLPRQVRCGGRSASGCCSFGVRDPGGQRAPCRRRAPRGSSDCALSLPALPLAPPVVHELVTCAGASLSVECRAPCGGGAAWRRRGAGTPLPPGSILRLVDVRREEAGTYLCDVTGPTAAVRLGLQVTVDVQFPPVILAPRGPATAPDAGLECAADASPPAALSWLADGAPLLPADPRFHVGPGARGGSRLLVEGGAAANLTCVAVNEHGRAEVTVPAPPPGAPAEERRRFNVPGFIAGMLPPLGISFYIILKLGYRSRYADDRGEDEGGEEPFFISY